MSERTFTKFVNAIGASKSEIQPYIQRQNGWEYYFFDYSGKQESFCCRTSTNDVDATFKGKYISDDGTGMPINELIDLYKAKVNLCTGPYAELLDVTNMQYGACTRNGFSVIGWRAKMSYGNGFKYGDIFRPCGKVARLINENQNSIECTKCWQNTEDTDVFLVNSLGFNFLITVEDLADALEVSPKEIMDLR